jgi:EAL domain-containing protein (putative c-di-GMP-specific phosphodiesterase class I)
MCRAIIHLGLDLEFRIIAEGVTTEDQLNFLRENRCEGAQGYLFSGNPIPREESPALN